jgi:ATP-dependent Clp protease adaptor protein ClpS
MSSFVSLFDKIKLKNHFAIARGTTVAASSPDTLPETDEETQTQRQPPYAVVLHNDDINTMQFVVYVLMKVFGYTLEKCYTIMMEAHETGRSVVWVGPLEVAELKADQIHSCGGDPTRQEEGAQPLGVTLEPMA